MNVVSTPSVAKGVQLPFQTSYAMEQAVDASWALSLAPKTSSLTVSKLAVTPSAASTSSWAKSLIVSAGIGAHTPWSVTLEKATTRKGGIMEQILEPKPLQSPISKTTPYLPASMFTKSYPQFLSSTFKLGVGVASLGLMTQALHAQTVFATPQAQHLALPQLTRSLVGVMPIMATLTTQASIVKLTQDTLQVPLQHQRERLDTMLQVPTAPFSPPSLSPRMPSFEFPAWTPKHGKPKKRRPWSSYLWDYPIATPWEVLTGKKRRKTK